MSVVDRAGESVARKVDRRSMISRGAAGLFGAVAAWTVSGFKAPPALARTCTTQSSSCACAPIGSFCNTIRSEFCYKGACSGGCRFYDEIYAPTGCWCTRNCCYRRRNGNRVCGYYKCCDCKCPDRVQCSCKHFVKTYPSSR